MKLLEKEFDNEEQVSKTMQDYFVKWLRSSENLCEPIIAEAGETLLPKLKQGCKAMVAEAGTENIYNMYYSCENV